MASDKQYRGSQSGSSEAGSQMGSETPTPAKAEKILTDIMKTFPEGSAAEEPMMSSVITEPVPRITSVRHEVPMFVPKVEIYEIVKEVPRPEIEYLEKIVEVPKIEYVDRYEEITKIEYVTKEVTKIEVVEVPREVIKRVPRIEIRTVERVVNVPAAEATHVVKPFPIEAQFLIPKFLDKRVSVPIAHEIQPEIYEASDVYEVDVARYTPVLIPVDVYVPKLIQVPVKDMGILHCEEYAVEQVDVCLLQQLTIELNPHLKSASDFNVRQWQQYQKLIDESLEQAAQYRVAMPEPISFPTIDMDGCAVDRATPMNIYEASQIDFLRDMPGFSQTVTPVMKMKPSNMPSQIGSAMSSHMPSRRMSMKSGVDGLRY